MDEDRGRQINRLITREFLVFLFAYGLPLVVWVILQSLGSTTEPGPPGEGGTGRSGQLLVPLLVYLPVQLFRLLRRRVR